MKNLRVILLGMPVACMFIGSAIARRGQRVEILKGSNGRVIIRE